MDALPLRTAHALCFPAACPPRGSCSAGAAALLRRERRQQPRAAGQAARGASATPWHGGRGECSSGRHAARGPWREPRRSVAANAGGPSGGLGKSAKRPGGGEAGAPCYPGGRTLLRPGPLACAAPVSPPWERRAQPAWRAGGHARQVGARVGGVLLCGAGAGRPHLQRLCAGARRAAALQASAQCLFPRLPARRTRTARPRRRSTKASAPSSRTSPTRTSSTRCARPGGRAARRRPPRACCEELCRHRLACWGRFPPAPVDVPHMLCCDACRPRWPPAAAGLAADAPAPPGPRRARR